MSKWICRLGLLKYNKICENVELICNYENVL